MALMKVTKHAIQKEKWQAMIRERTESGLSIKAWCAKNQVSEGSYYYWLKTIREDSLMRAGTLAVAGGTEFAELSTKATESKRKSDGVCAVIHFQEIELVIHNGADYETLETVIQLIRQSC
jgi:transposase-like protein